MNEEQPGNGTIKRKDSASMTSKKSNKNHNSSKTSSKKRQRPEEVFHEQAVDYFKRLVYKCQKVFNKQIKATKKLEYLKLIKRQQQNKESTVEEFKQVTVDSIVQEALRRLGIHTLDPAKTFVEKIESDEDSPSDASQKEDDQETSIENDSVYSDEENEDEASSISEESDSEDHEKSNLEQKGQWVIENILSNQRLVKLMEEWSEETRKYRTWFVQGRERLEQPTQPSQKKSKKKGSKQKNRSSDRESSIHQQQEQEYLTHGQSVFVQLGDAPPIDDDGGVNPEEDHGDIEDDANMLNPYYVPDELKKKKNRPGQRARKAKAQALEAKKAGRKNRPVDESLNWRSKKSAESGAQDSKHNRKSSPSFKHQKATPVEDSSSGLQEELHPSWAARKTQSSAIAKFQGTKITFD